MSEVNQGASADGRPGAFNNCPDWGKGGQFVYDPVTKTRKRVDVQGAVAPGASDNETAVPAVTVPSATATPTKKERNRAKP